MKLYGNSICILSLAACILMSCQEEQIITKMSISPLSATVNGGGETILVEVNCNSEWSLHIMDNEDGWLSVDPAYGTGPAEVLLTALPSDEAGRTAEIVLSSSGMEAVMTVEAGEVCWIGENFDAGKAPMHFPYPEIEGYGGWQKYGLGSSTAEYVGNGSYVVRVAGNNSVWMENISSEYEMNNIDMSYPGDGIYTLSFDVQGSYQDENAESTAVLGNGDLSLSVSSTGIDYIPVSYSPVSNSDWQTMQAIFGMYNASRMYVKWVAESPGIRLDNVLLVKGREPALDSPVMIVGAGEATEVGKTSAVLNGRWVYSGRDPVIETGFTYWMEDEPENIVSVVSDTGASVFDYQVSGLAEGETYVFRAFVRTSSGTSFSKDMKFITLVDAVDARISDVRKLWNGTDAKLPAGWTLHATVISDFSGGNMSTDEIAVVDGTTGNSGLFIRVVDDSGTGTSLDVPVNSDVDISLRGVRFATGGRLMIEVPASNITVNGSMTGTVAVALPSVEDVREYDGMLVSIDDVQAVPAYIPRPWGSGMNEEPGIVDVPMQSKSGEFHVRTLPEAEFAYGRVGKNSGRITGICLCENGNVYIMPRKNADIELFDDRIGPLTEKIVYYEDFGISSKNTKFPDYDGFRSENQPDTYWETESTKCDVRISKVYSFGYPGASGNSEIYCNEKKAYFYLKGLNTLDCGYMYFTMGASYNNNKQVTVNTKHTNFVIEYSADQGDSWTNVPYTCIVEGQGDSVQDEVSPWGLIEFDASLVIPESEDLWFRFSFTVNNGRIDDLRLVRYE